MYISWAVGSGQYLPMPTLSTLLIKNNNVQLRPTNISHFISAGLSSPPANLASSVPSIVTPIVNGFTGIAPQPNGHPVEAVYANGLPPYSTQSPTAADTLQQAFTGVQQYTGTLVHTNTHTHRHTV
uniref:Uncharacterized protein n=1 Tax=Astyanax mexicanus TaxID=7994 RepID=A0A8B9HMN7_ASTMX